MEADLTVRGTHQLALRLTLAISKESARAINVARPFIRTLALRCSCMCAFMTESGIRRVGIFIFLPLLNLLPNDKINSIKHGSPDNKLCRPRAPVGTRFSNDASRRYHRPGGEPQKLRNRQYSDKQKRQTYGPPRFVPALHETHLAAENSQ